VGGEHLCLGLPPLGFFGLMRGAPASCVALSCGVAQRLFEGVDPFSVVHEVRPAIWHGMGGLTEIVGGEPTQLERRRSTAFRSDSW
jgi:hypothetical protein